MSRSTHHVTTTVVLTLRLPAGSERLLYFCPDPLFRGNATATAASTRDDTVTPVDASDRHAPTASAIAAARRCAVCGRGPLRRTSTAATGAGRRPPRRFPRVCRTIAAPSTFAMNGGGMAQLGAICRCAVHNETMQLRERLRGRDHSAKGYLTALGITQSTRDGSDRMRRQPLPLRSE
jgi:hypothetical protein